MKDHRDLLERGSPSAAREPGGRHGPTSTPHPESGETLRLPRSLLWVGLPLDHQELTQDLREGLQDTEGYFHS